MRFNQWCQSDKGLRRTSNQDTFLMNPDLGLYVVADGMGGHSGGEVASAMAVKTVEAVIKEYKNSIPDPRDLVLFAYREASQRIYDKAAKENPELLGMGTTMVVLLLSGDSAYVGNVGDSRAYLYRKPFLWQVTEDHSLVNEHLRAGTLTQDQVATFSSKNVITRSVGYEREVEVDILERPLQDGDKFLICSDGLSGLVPDAEMTEIFKNNPDEKIVPTCIERALQKGGVDNVTVLLLSVTE